MKRLALVVTLLVGLVLVSGCAAEVNSAHRNGGYLTTTAGRYIVIVWSGGHLLDVYKLGDQYVQSEAHSDGWNFIMDNGDTRMVGGDVTVIRVKDNATWERYHEYHLLDELQKEK